MLTHKPTSQNIADYLMSAFIKYSLNYRSTENKTLRSTVQQDVFDCYRRHLVERSHNHVCSLHTQRATWQFLFISAEAAKRCWRPRCSGKAVTWFRKSAINKRCSGAGRWSWVSRCCRYLPAGAAWKHQHP